MERIKTLKRVSLATRKAYGRTNEKLKWEDKIILKPVSAVISESHTTTSTTPHNCQAIFGCVELGSK
jgi:hypothetical protein